jgi:hypothetical protein
MALVGTDNDPIRYETTPPGWSFRMRDETNADVQVIVTDLALEGLGAGAFGLDPFHAHRAEIERLASAKHSAGKLENDGRLE